MPGHVPWIVGTTQDPFASLTDPVEPVTANPLQLVLLTLASWIRGATMIEGAGSAAAKLRIERKMMADAARVVVTRCRIANFLKRFLRERNQDKPCGIRLC